MMALRGAIVSAGYTQRSLAKALNMSENTMNSKVNGKNDFTPSEITEVCRELNIKEDQMKIGIFIFNFPKTERYQSRQASPERMQQEAYAMKEERGAPLKQFLDIPSQLQHQKNHNKRKPWLRKD